ncbi:hypothetical protein UCREL1_4670 [Eutypa lata UCREL1]|uniref:Uncharacterized protein n=1 Tax=Eutypa lata (strain UCR-EL1) TaxID=1287681 RepID=M7TNM3_EUTLA|nr:hypothetical protein UCREL1_4670 [Eutypa lata UCREL1]
MLVWGIRPPMWMFSDSLPVFKLAVNPNEGATLATLASRYTLWFPHVQRDALSDAKAPMYVVTMGISDWQTACMAFATICRRFMTSVGLNTFIIRDSNPFPTGINTPSITEISGVSDT